MENPQANETDAQLIAEISLSLRNLSYTISGIVTGDSSLADKKLNEILFEVHRQTEMLSSRLDRLNGRCKECIASQSQFVPNTCPAAIVGESAVAKSPSCDDCSIKERLTRLPDSAEPV